MFGGEIMFAKLPSIKNITIQNEQARGDALYIGKEFFSTTSICSQMKVGHDNYINGAFLHFKGLTKIDLLFKLIITIVLTDCD